MSYPRQGSDGPGSYLRQDGTVGPIRGGVSFVVLEEADLSKIKIISPDCSKVQIGPDPEFSGFEVVRLETPE